MDTIYDEAAAQMRDPKRYATLIALTFAERHPCPIADCRLSAEEHHRLAFGYLSENAALRRRVEELEHGRATEPPDEGCADRTCRGERCGFRSAGA